MKQFALLVLCLAFALGAASAAWDEPPTADRPSKPPYDPVERYVKQRVEGWDVLVNKQLDAEEHRELRGQTLRVLGEHLFRVTRVVPAEALAELRKVPFWVELAHPKHPCMCYHPSSDWLRENGMNPAKARSVEIANAKTFLRWTIDQPWMVLHELAHGYHHRVLGYDHAGVRACFERAAAAKKYESVLHIGGRTRRHYALNNPMEYFAEGSEAYFGTNDFFPFVRAELRQHDPEMYELLGKLWKVPGAKGEK